MAAKDLGTKFVCFKCGTRFYDLKRPDPLCPKCGTDQRESPALRPPERSERRRSMRAALEAPEIEQEVIEEEEEEIGAEEDYGEAGDEEEDY